MMVRRTALSLLFALLALRGQAQDWPEFRGPTGQGHSAEVNLPLEWSETQNILWKTPVPGRGWSSPVVSAGRVWMTSSVPERWESLRVLAFDVETGRELVNVEVFQRRGGSTINAKASHASPTPIVEGDRVYVHFGADGTAALTTDGKIVWKTRLDYDPQEGNGGSPALFGDLLIVGCDGTKTAYVVALDKQTGKTRWKTFRRDPWGQSYATPLVIRVGEQDQVVSLGANRGAAYDARTGKEIWRVNYEGFSNVPRPVFGRGLVFITTGFQNPSLLAVRPDGTGDVTKTHVAWTLRRGAPWTPSPLLVGDELYVIADTGVASCLDAVTGRAYWQQRISGNHSASPIFADGRIYFLSEQGVATVIAPGREFRRLATNQLDGDTLASIAVSGGSLFIRSTSHINRIGTKS